MAQKFVIQTDFNEVEEAVQKIEQDFAFRSVQAIKSLRLDADEERIVLEIARKGRATVPSLQAAIGLPQTALERLLAQMTAKTYLAELPTVQPPTYVLSFYLQPPKPLSPEVAHEINNQINREGGVTNAYVRQIYDSLGEPGLKIIGDVMEEQGRKYAGALAAVRGGGPSIVGHRYIELMQANGAPIECVEESETEVVYLQHECPYKLKNGEVELCNAVNGFDRALLSELGCSLKFTERIVEGATHCRAVIFRQSQSDERKVGQQNASSNS